MKVSGTKAYMVINDHSGERKFLINRSDIPRVGDDNTVSVYAKRPEKDYGKC